MLLEEAGLEGHRLVNTLTPEDVDTLARIFSEWPDKPVVFDAGDIGEIVKETVNRVDLM